MNKYSVVFMPNLQTIEAVKQLKLLLSDKIGWFNSKNSLAHFTIFEFFENDVKEDTFCLQLDRIASEIDSFNIKCDAFDWFDNGVFYIKPNQISSAKMTELMKQVIKESIQIKKAISNTNPHLSIARRLSPEKLEIAQQLFTNINLEFTVTNLTLRKFDESLKQFTVYKEFPLLGKPKEIQGTLF
ncbi:2'-5' RNA ligase family protein [Flavobacterium dauae]|uniref:2'-5' RNA ligase family protein n=1 Tax=Flavobacterium dauae TaxID=1563479 RepID=UPI00101B2EB2|nr:2'-5' RNA ligase family protein [Flavobacterium dauae]WLD24028.1 2'-5' RNA ligase family protein [Flavobacterium dauae]